METLILSSHKKMPGMSSGIFFMRIKGGLSVAAAAYPVLLILRATGTAARL
jgi:hypothetical protein